MAEVPQVRAAQSGRNVGYILDYGRSEGSSQGVQPLDTCSDMAGIRAA